MADHLIDDELLPAEPEDAFWDYELALLVNDVPALDAAFTAGPPTIRSDAGVTLVGHEAIAAFRASRPPVPPRRVDRLHRRDLDPDTVVLVAETVRAGGGTGVVTQLWRRGAGGWQIAVAHVSLGADAAIPGLDADQLASIWRVAPGTASFPTGTRSALAGVGVAVKDLYAVAGQSIGGGNPHVLAEQPVQRVSAAAVRALVDAGAHVAGIAHTDELAYSIAGTNRHYGAPVNAAAPGHLTGGSSSGSAAAVAAGLADVGLGTDTAGSIRVPASYCGLWGMRPTHDAISLDGVLPLAPSFDTAGVLARSPELLVTAMRALLPVQAGPVDRPTRLVLSPTLVASADPATRLAFAAALRAFAGREGLSATVLDDDVTPVELDDWGAAFRRLQAYEAWQAHGERVERHAGTFQPEIEARFRSGSVVTPAQEHDDRMTLVDASSRVAALVPAGTVLALPATSGPAPSATAAPADLEVARAATLRLTFLASATGTPVVVLPTGRVGALPVGLALLGARGTDHELLSLVPTEPRRPDWTI